MSARRSTLASGAVARSLAVRRVAATAVIVASIVGLAPRGSADDDRLTRGPLPAPVGVAAENGAFALDTNPSLLPFVPRYAAVVGHARVGDHTLDRTGTSAYVALALSRFGLGVGFDRRVEPGRSVGRFSLALAYAPSARLSVGAAFRKLGADGSLRGGSTLDLALTYRPSPRLSFSATAEDVLAPTGLGGLEGQDVAAALGLFVAFRPFGTETFTTEAGLVADTDGQLRGRLYASLAFARLGRVYVVGRLDDFTGAASSSMLAGLEFRLDGIGAGSGLVTREDGTSGFVAYASVDGRAAQGLVERDRLIDLAISGSLSASELVTHLLALDRARLDPHVAGAVLRLRGTGMGMAAAQELRAAVALLTSGDRPVTCVLESPTGAELYACGTATETFMDEAGTIRLLGPSADLVAYGALLERVGVHADFVRIGAYKTAPERWTNTAPSAEALAQTTAYLEDAYERLVQDMACDLHVERAVIRDAIDRGPHGLSSAVTIGLVDGAMDTSELERELERLHGRTLPLAAASAAPHESTWGTEARVAVVVVDGTIVDRASASIPVIGMRTSGADTIVATLERLRHDASVHAVVLRIDSPGGSSTASDRIYRAVRRLAADKPVVASMGSVAASGGYYIASAAGSIYADPTTLTGSIGVYFGKFDVAPLADRLGVGIASIERGAHAGASSIFRPLDDDERARLETLVAETYALFLRRVAEGRGRTVESLEGLGEGRIFSGDHAIRVGLVDRLGGLLPAIAHARVLADLDEDSPAVVVGGARPSLVARVLDSLVDADAPSVRALRPLAWLLFTDEAAMFALAPFDEGAH